MTLRIEFGRAGDGAGDDERPLPDPAADLQVAKDFVSVATRFNVLAIELKLWDDEEFGDQEESKDAEAEDDEREAVAFLGVAPGVLLSWYQVSVDSEAAQLIRAGLEPMRVLSDPYRTMPGSARGTVMDVKSVDDAELDLIRDALWDLRSDIAAIKKALGGDEDDDGDDDQGGGDWGDDDQD